MPAKKKAATKPTKANAAKPTLEPTTPPGQEPRDAATGRPRTGAEQEIAGDEGKGPEPSDVNDMLASDRMKDLLEDHRRMGSRP